MGTMNVCACSWLQVQIRNFKETTGSRLLSLQNKIAAIKRKRFFLGLDKFGQVISLDKPR